MSDHTTEVFEDVIYPRHYSRLADEYGYPLSHAYLEARAPVLVFFSILCSIDISFSRILADFLFI